MTSLRISDAAAATGIPATTLRYWEQAGLLHSARTVAGYRTYDEHDLERLRFISAAKQLELPLDAIADLLHAWDDESCATVKARMRPMLSTRLQRARSDVDELHHLASTLRAGLVALDALPDRQSPCDPDCASVGDGSVAASAPACTLSGHDRREQIRRWSQLLADARVVREGLTATVTLPVEHATAAAALVVDEQACCPFLDSALTFTGGTATLTITAPNADALPFLDALLDAPEVACSATTGSGRVDL